MASMAFQALAAIIMLVSVFAQQASAKTHYLNWTVENATLTRDCHTVTVATVNGISPGPTVIIDEDDTLVITVTNKQIYPVTLHWHGIRQFGTNYADGPAYITQCPIMEGGSYIYEFTVSGQTGTFFYHAHIGWLRATVHGALVVKPKAMAPYGAVEAEIPIVLAEWVGTDPNAYGASLVDTLTPTENTTTITPTVNGNAGPLYGCSNGEITQYKLKPNKVYLLRIVNAAMNNDYYFRVGGHKVTVVGADANYLKPFRTNEVALTPGQTTDVLLITSKTPGKYYFGFDVGPSPIGVGFPPPHISALGLFEYTNAKPTKVVVPKFPNNVTLKPMDKYVAKLKALESYALKKTPDQNLIYIVNTAITACTATEPCVFKVMGAVQNITFDLPTTTSILQAYASGTNGVYTADFPDLPPSLDISVVAANVPYNIGSRGTRVKSLNYGDVVQVVFQNLYSGGGSILDHPFHLHGHDFYVVGRGYGVYNPATDPAKFNLVNPPLFNTFGIPNGGWISIRFLANNPGVWLLHCHFERHIGWGMEMVFITKNGGGQSLKAPTHPLPSCSA